MKTHIKKFVKGAMIAYSGAYAWALLGCELSEVGHGESRFLFHFWIAPLAAGYAVLLASWFVLPIGCLLGVIIPANVRNRSKREAFIKGLLIGACVGLTAAALTTVCMQWPNIFDNATIVDRHEYLKTTCSQFIVYLATMIPFCSIWVGIWAWSLSQNSATT